MDITTKGLPACDAILHVAGTNIMNPLRRFNTAFQHDLFVSRISTTEMIVDAIKRMPASLRPRIYIGVSGINYYSSAIPWDKETRVAYEQWNQRKELDWCDFPPFPAISTESSNCGTSFFSKLCADWERSSEPILSLQKDYVSGTSSMIHRVILRCGAVLGVKGGVASSLYYPFKFGFGGPLLPGYQPFPWIHLEDVCGLFLHALKMEQSVTMNAVSPHIITSAHFTKALADTLHRPHLFPIPEVVSKLLMGRERAQEMLLSGVRAFPKTACASGFHFRYPRIDSAWQQIVNEWQHKS